MPCHAEMRPENLAVGAKACPGCGAADRLYFFQMSFGIPAGSCTVECKGCWMQGPHAYWLCPVSPLRYISEEESKKLRADALALWDKLPR